MIVSPLLRVRALQQLALACSRERDRSVIFHACAEKSPVYLSLPKFVHELTIPTLSPVQNLVTIGSRIFLFTVVQKCPFPINTVVTITTACTSVQP